jgi:hypothetical protein
MGFIPEDAKWYVADIVIEFLIQDDPRNVVHINTVLIGAKLPEDAYAKALDLGKSHEMSYLNPDGKNVKVRFRGLRDLNVIHDELEHGAELCYQEQMCVPESIVSTWVRAKEDLRVFAPISQKTEMPNYAPESVIKELEAHFGRDHASEDEQA